MSSKIRRDLSDKSRTVYQCGPWFVSINRKTRRCEATSGDYWFPVPRSEARALILRRVG